MKSRSIILLVLVAIFSYSCADDLTNVGVSIQPSSDEISIGVDTFHVITEDVFVESIYTRQDSFLLGTFYNEKYGSTNADIFAQLDCPEGYKFPSNAVPDSAFVYLYYTTWFGDDYSPLDVSIYELNKKTFDFTGYYPSDLTVSDYTDQTQLLSRRVFTAAGVSDLDTKAVKFPMPKSFVDRIFADSAAFVSSETFLKSFGGLYITTKLGSASILNISQINMLFYYHHVISKNGTDTTIVTPISFPANEWVRQVNRYVHSDREEIVKHRDSVNYIASPANLETRVRIPLRKMEQRMKSKTLDKELKMNSALLNVEVTEVDDATLAVPVSSYLLLIKESSMDRFFKNNELPSDTCAVLGAYTSVLNDSTGEYDYYYSFDTATLIANEIKNNNTDEYLNMRLVPVRVTLDSYSSVTEVKHQFLMTGVTVKSGSNTVSPMRINAVFSGF